MDLGVGGFFKLSDGNRFEADYFLFYILLLFIVLFGADRDRECIFDKFLMNCSELKEEKVLSPSALFAWREMFFFKNLIKVLGLFFPTHISYA